MTPAADPRIQMLLENLDRAFDERSWHGPNLLGSLRGVKVEVASWQPGPERHCIWELMLHAAYWKYIVRRHVTGNKDLSFPRSPSDFPALPDPATPEQFKADLELLRHEHSDLRAAVAGFDADRLETRPGTQGPTFLDLILGVAAHDVHHGGQIQLLKRLQQG